MSATAIARGQLLTLPEGWDASQFKPEQPINTYKDFKGEILTEAGQPVGAPRNIATGSSAEYNYSSGRLDHGIYQRGIEVRRSAFRERVLDKILRAWLDEAALTPGLIPEGLVLLHLWTWEWYYDGFVSLDPSKDADTNDKRLRNCTITHSEIASEEGMDWEERAEQRAYERNRFIELGLPDVADEATMTVQASAAPLDPSQVTALLDLTDRLAGRGLSAQSTEAIIQAAFPSIKLDTVRKFVRGLGCATPDKEGATCA